MEQDNKITKVGIGVMIFKDGQILIGKRQKSHGAGEYAFPGGHLEYMEGFAECAEREVIEETKMKIKNIRFECVGNSVEFTPKHYVHLGLLADWESGEPVVSEPDKCDGWAWYDFDNLPSPLFSLCTMMIESYKSGKNYYDKK